MLLSSLTIGISGCAKEPEPAGLQAHLCRTWQPISVSKKDTLTDQTKKEIVGNNAANELWCPRPKETTATQVAKK